MFIGGVSRACDVARKKQVGQKKRGREVLALANVCHEDNTRSICRGNP